MLSGSSTERGTEGSARLVEDDLAPCDGAAHGVEVAQVALDQLDIVERAAQVLAAAGAEVVEHAHLDGRIEQSIEQMAADKAAAAGYERGSHMDPFAVAPYI